jgi:hypothetical protein
LQAGLDEAALVRRLRKRLAGERRQQGRRDAKRGGAAEEVAARDPALAGKLGEMVEFVLLFLPLFL